MRQDIYIKENQKVTHQQCCKVARLNLSTGKLEKKQF